jgi:hypothetical protein
MGTRKIPQYRLSNRMVPPDDRYGRRPWPVRQAPGDVDFYLSTLIFLYIERRLKVKG